MIDRIHDLPIARHAKVLNISRGSVYDKPRPTSAEDLALMRRIDELQLEYPFAGSRMLLDLRNREGLPAGRRHIATLMKRMGIEAIYRRPNKSKPAPENKICPYLLGGLKVESPNQLGRRASVLCPCPALRGGHRRWHRPRQSPPPRRCGHYLQWGPQRRRRHRAHRRRLHQSFRRRRAASPPNCTIVVDTGLLSVTVTDATRRDRSIRSR